MIGRVEPKGPVYGAIADFVLRPDPTMVFRNGQDGAALFEMTANIMVQALFGLDGCRGWFEDFVLAGDPVSLDDLVATVMASGVKHHFVAIPGTRSDLLAEFSAWAGSKSLRRRPVRSHLFSGDSA